MLDAAIHQAIFGKIHLRNWKELWLDQTDLARELLLLKQLSRPW
jgi:hypothetical protein